MTTWHFDERLGFACPACRARYTDEQLRDMIARQPKEEQNP